MPFEEPIMPEICTEEFVQQYLNYIKQIAYDDEVAHSREDKLHQAVLSYIAEGKIVDPMLCAKLALTSQNIEFARWCA